jgi:hypothetical protein
METLAPAILQYGGPGIIIVALLYAVLRLFNLYTASMEQRITAEQRVTTAIESNTDALQHLKDAVLQRRKT